MQQRFLLQILLLAQHVSGTTMPIIWSSRVLYSGCFLLVFRAVVFKLLVSCGAEGYVSFFAGCCSTIMPIIRSSRVLYSGCCLWYLVLRFSRCWSGVELWVVCPVCRMLQHSANISVEKVISFCKYKQ